MPRTVIPLAERFWKRVKKSNGCWVWTGTLRSDGYGVIGIGNRSEGLARVHVLSWELVNGPVLDGLCVCHKCDNPPCVRPDHLFLGTRAENDRDRDRKNRVGHGVKHYARKITPNIVRQIRKLYAGGMFQRDIGEMFGMSRTGISAVCVGRTWRRVV